MIRHNMKCFGRTAICLGVALNCCILTRAVGQAEATNPYTTIAARNVFGLESQQPEPPVVQPAEIPPKILPDGITTIFGQQQVLFKVVTLQNSPGAQTKQSFYILAEGEQQDGVRVTHIDMITGTVTFNNHGTIQELPLTNFSAIGTATKPPPTPAQILFNLSNRSQ